MMGNGFDFGVILEGVTMSDIVNLTKLLKIPCFLKSGLLALKLDISTPYIYM